MWLKTFNNVTAKQKKLTLKKRANRSLHKMLLYKINHIGLLGITVFKLVLMRIKTECNWSYFKRFKSARCVGEKNSRYHVALEFIFFH